MQPKDMSCHRLSMCIAFSTIPFYHSKLSCVGITFCVFYIVVVRNLNIGISNAFKSVVDRFADGKAKFCIGVFDCNIDDIGWVKIGIN